jgi:hypothetical protein
MRKAEILASLVFIGFSLAIIQQARQVGIGWSEAQPQSGFFPFWLALFLGVCAVVVLGQTLVRARASGAFFHDRAALMSVAKITLTALAMLVLTYVVGFYTAAIAYMFVYTRFVGKHRWPAVIALSLLIPFGSYYLFERVLQILLPRGVYSILPF